MIMQLASMHISIPWAQREGRDESKDETAAPNALPAHVKVALDALKCLDIELVAACFQDWKDRLQEQRTLRDTAEVAAFVQAQHCLAQVCSACLPFHVHSLDLLFAPLNLGS